MIILTTQVFMIKLKADLLRSQRKETNVCQIWSICLEWTNWFSKL